MSRFLQLTFVAFFVAAMILWAEEAAPKKPSGKYTRDTGDAKLIWEFKGEKFSMTLERGETTIKAHGSFGVTSESVLFGVLTKVEKSGDEGPSKGDLFRFQYELGKGEMTISDLAGTHTGEAAKKLVEGAYKSEK